MLYGLNWVDAVIILFVLLMAAEGLRIGFLSQIFAITGFFAVLFLAGQLFPHLLPIHDQTARTIVNGTLVLLAATFAGIGGADIGQDIHWSFRIGRLVGRHNFETAETILGGLPSAIASLILVWLLAVTVGQLPFAGFSNSVSDALIVQQLTRALPAAPAVFAKFNRNINPNAQPYVFIQPKPQPNFSYSAKEFQTAKAWAAASLVRITSFSCGGITSGSGFAVSKDLVATNAHVVAGSKRPIIKYKGGSYEGIPIYFDANIDLAIMRVQRLNATPLPLFDGVAPLNSTAAVAGYPSNNYRVVPGIIRDTLAVDARSIYDQGLFGRGVYVVQASTAEGSSGGPVILPDGQAIGVIFSKSNDIPNTAYALNSSLVTPALDKAGSSHIRVGTGACIR
jgi:S1-C subfamily serine protease